MRVSLCGDYFTHKDTAIVDSCQPSDHGWVRFIPGVLSGLGHQRLIVGFEASAGLFGAHEQPA
jgi:hypothetical protein